MDPKIDAIATGPVQSYLIRQDGVILVDAGTPKKSKKILSDIASAGTTPDEVNLIVITHGHYDHIGSAKDMAEACQAKIAMHANEKEWLEQGRTVMPPGATTRGKILAGIMKIFSPMIKFPSGNVDIVISDEGMSLKEYGISGKVFFTPGHSPGSLSVLLENGDAFVGDLCMSAPIMRKAPGFPIFADSYEQIKSSWKLLLDNGAKTIYPGHGKPFPAENLREGL